MTNNLKCPFCGAELENGHSWSYYCTNSFCEHSDFCGTLEMWQALIDGKAAQDALKEATKCINWTIDTIAKGLDREADIVGCCEISLERINAITTQEKE